MNALITGATITTVALVIFFFMLRKMLSQKGEIHELQRDLETAAQANRELSKALARALRPPANTTDGERVLDKIQPKPSLSTIVHDSNS